MNIEEKNVFFLTQIIIELRYKNIFSKFYCDIILFQKKNNIVLIKL